MSVEVSSRLAQMLCWWNGCTKWTSWGFLIRRYLVLKVIAFQGYNCPIYFSKRFGVLEPFINFIVKIRVHVLDIWMKTTLQKTCLISENHSEMSRCYHTNTETRERRTPNQHSAQTRVENNVESLTFKQKRNKDRHSDDGETTDESEGFGDSVPDHRLLVFWRWTRNITTDCTSQEKNNIADHKRRTWHTTTRWTSNKHRCYKQWTRPASFHRCSQSNSRL